MPAIAAVAGADVVLVALVAMILAVATFTLFRPLISGALSKVPLIGSWLASNTDLILFSAYVSALSWINTSIGPLVDFIRRLRWATVLTIDEGVQTVEAGWSAIWRVRYTALPAAIAAANTYAAGLFGQALAYIATAIASVQHYAELLAAHDLAYAQSLYVSALSYVQSLHLAELQYVQAAVLDAERYAAQLEAGGLAYAQAAVLAAEHYAQALNAQTLAYVQAAVLEAEELARRVGVDAEGYAQALQRQALGYAAATGAAVAAAAGAATAAVAARVATIEDSPCQRFCSPLGDLGGLLQGLRDVGMAALLLDLAVTLAEDPQGAAQAIDGIAGGPVRELLSDLGFAAGQGARGFDAFVRPGGPAWTGA